MWKVGFVPSSNALNWIVPYSSVSNLNCASFQDHQSKLCLSPITQNWSVPNSNLPQWLVPYSNVPKLNCALFQCPTIELCLVPMPSKWIVPYSNVAKWNVPYSNAIKLNCALFLCHKIKCALHCGLLLRNWPISKHSTKNTGALGHILLIWGGRGWYSKPFV